MYLILSRKTPSVALEMTRQAPVRIGRLQRVSPTRGNLESGQYCGQVVRYAALACIGTRQLLSILSIKSPAYYFTMKYHGLLMWDDYIIRLGWHNSQGPQTPNGSLQKARRILQYSPCRSIHPSIHGLVLPRVAFPYSLTRDYVCLFSSSPPSFPWHLIRHRRPLSVITAFCSILVPSHSNSRSMTFTRIPKPPGNNNLRWSVSFRIFSRFYTYKIFRIPKILMSSFPS